MTRSTSRREVLLGAAALAGTVSLPRTASAQPKGRIVVGTWGGDYARLLNKNIEVPILIKDGWEVVQDQAGDPERRSKMLAEQRLPRGTSDVQGLSALNMFQMQDAGTVLPIDYGKLKNAGNLLPPMKYPYGVGHIYSGKVGVYNPKLITTAPVSYKDVFDPRHGNKLGIIDIQYQYTLVCAALAAGGKVNDIEPGKKLLLECKNAGMRIYPTNEAFAQGLKSEELGIGVMWKARVRSVCRGHGLQSHRHQRDGGARSQPTHRLHPRRGQKTRRSRLRLHEQKRRRVQGMVGQGAEELSWHRSRSVRPHETTGRKAYTLISRGRKKLAKQ